MFFNHFEWYNQYSLKAQTKIHLPFINVLYMNKRFYALLLLLMPLMALAQEGTSQLDIWPDFKKVPYLDEKVKGHDFTITLKDMPDTTVILGYYSSGKTWIRDTGYTDTKGMVQFKGEELWDGGVYLVAVNGAIVFEFIYSATESGFSMSTTGISKTMENMKIKGSPENQLFLDYQLARVESGRKMEKLNKRYKVLKERKDKDSMEVISDLAGDAQSDFQKYQIDITKNHPKSMTALIINLIREPEVPDPPKAEIDGEPVDTAFWQYLWYKKHYWDYVDFSDDRIVRTPVFKEKVMKFIGPKLTAQIPDTICETGQKFIDATREGNKFVYRNVLTWIVSKYEESNIMGMNAVVCCLAQKYYINDPECDWLKPRKKQKFVDHIAKECNVVIGKQSRDLVMMDFNGVPRSLHSVPSKYTVVYFYSATCGHCKKITPKVHKLYKEYKDKGLAVYSVNVDYKEVKDDDGNIINLVETKDYREYVLKNNFEWINVADPLHQTKFRDHYNIYSTPVIYLLDENKNFIGVRLDSVTLRRMIMHEIDGMSHEDIDVWLEENGYSADDDEDTGEDEHEGHDHGDEGSNH